MRSGAVVVVVSAVFLGLGLVSEGCAARFEVDGARAHARVVEQVEMGPRVPGSPGHAAALRWLQDTLKALGAEVRVQSFVDSTLGVPLELHNVIGRYRPDRERRIVLAAHWDTRAWCDRDPDSSFQDQPVPGANDGASGVAVLLEVAELMRRTAPPTGVDLVFFDGEDQGHEAEEYSLGARGYARALTADPDARRAIVGVFVFDMVGDRDLNIYVDRNSMSKAANLVAMVLEGAAATGGKHFHSEVRYSVIDDHVPLLEIGVPAVTVIDFDYAAWHTHRDLPAEVSAESLAEVARVAAWIAYRSPFTRQ